MSDPRDSLLVHQQPLRLGFDGHCVRSLGRDDLMFSPPQDFQLFLSARISVDNKMQWLERTDDGISTLRQLNLDLRLSRRQEG
jgi:uncharacterized lipoprotein YbaY